MPKGSIMLHCFNDIAEKHLQDVRDQADKLGLREDLEAVLARLSTWGHREKSRCVLFKDFAPLSFAFNIEALLEDGTYKFDFNGGLIFHGPHDGFGDGGAPSFSVDLGSVFGEQKPGWSIHT
jgi:hypothetical protein